MKKLAVILCLFSVSVFASVVDAIQKAASEHKISEDYLCKIAQIESALNPNASNASNAIGAKGLFQITSSTQRLLEAKYKLSGDIFDPYYNSVLVSKLTQEHANILKRWNLEANHVNLYLLHFFGVSAGYKFLTTNSSVIIKDKFPKEYKYNKYFIKNLTVGQFKEKLAHKLNKAKNCRDI